MNHKAVVQVCERNGLSVARVPACAGRAFNATGEGVRVYWRVSDDSDYLLGLPRVCKAGYDTHARSVREVEYLVKR